MARLVDLKTEHTYTFTPAPRHVAEEWGLEVKQV